MSEQAEERAGTPAGDVVDALRERLERYVGRPMGPSSVAPDPVNVPMIRHWVDALDDRNPVYLPGRSRDPRRFMAGRKREVEIRYPA